MREIKFRAWQLHSSLYRKPGMYDVTSLDIYEKPFQNGNRICTGEVFFKGHKSSEYLEDVVVEQSTGLKDKNGVAIYEGDIVWAGVYNSDTGRRSCWQIEAPDPIRYWFGQFGINPTEHYINDIEVIGNIHENPELLK